MSSYDQELKSDLTLMLHAVESSSSLALARFGKEQKIWQKSTYHPVCEADKEVNENLYEILMTARPNYGWLSEETVDDGSRLKCSRTWVVDPIDGTNSYLNGIAEFAISVALVEGGKPIAAVVSNPANRQTFSAFAGGGATLNNNSINVSNTRKDQRISILSSRSENKESGWANYFSKDTVQTVSSIAYKFALVAAGQYDAAASVWPKNDWDICAGHLLVEEAGGMVTSLKGMPLIYNCNSPRHNTCAASNGRIHGNIIERLESFAY
tara:strand:+ start:16257 stop:17057 length:801 start_codon:yes stop_codon:yes gene_type:complete